MFIFYEYRNMSDYFKGSLELYLFTPTSRIKSVAVSLNEKEKNNF